MNYNDLMIESAEKFSSIICMGMDPVLEEIPEQKDSVGSTLVNFYEKILNKIIQKKIYPGAVKPNYAFYGQYGIEGIQALYDIIQIYRKENIPVILDYKRGDIGKTANAYAKEAFEFFKADSVTLSPYLGYDSIEPYAKNYPDKGYYILNKTSNSSSQEIQDILIDGEKEFYLYISEKLIEWYTPGIGAVVGATYPEQLNKISDLFISANKEIPFLIPGVGTQGGSVEEVMKALKKFRNYKIHRINASSSINYAYKVYSDVQYDEAATIALEELNSQVNI